ncbi:hypothetical protein SCHPADRAFT_842152 [Schizopora paradoxa]|uniref:Reactive mitochondrial oxygen species modulator 1-domain-containing protein n=1 Tax=Schizopora paradoxa TaxID=27342 RepID=A0A0H2SE93_9AGAM|nr:hypothetical protein SCHPADRAFT_842152 [Schizopora paradoxa]
MPPPPQQQYGQPTVWQKRTMGAMMGGGVGLTIGFIFGSYSIIRGGAGPRGAMATLSQYMLSSAATFSFFLAIGSVIRSDSHLLPPHMEALALQSRFAPQTLHSKIVGSRIVRELWEAEMKRHKA